jgi:hypothetical protein
LVVVDGGSVLAVHQEPPHGQRMVQLEHLPAAAAAAAAATMAAAVEAAAAAIESMLQIRIAGSCRHSSPCCQYADHLAALARSVRSVTGSAPPRALKPPGLKTGTPRLV